jgi:hypothetical protein
MLAHPCAKSALDNSGLLKQPPQEESKNMSDSEHIEGTIRDFFAATSTDEVAALSLADQVEMHGPMLPEPLHGEVAVREHLHQLAPFIKHTEVLELVIDRNSAAARTLTHSINGVELEGAYFFRIYQGQISRIRSLFDTRVLLAGGR